MTASFSIDGLSVRSRGQLISHRPWTLCLGAGINGRLVPTWQELARRLFVRYFEAEVTSEQFGALVEKSKWSLDSWIQTALNKCLAAGGTEAQFSAEVGSAIYADLFARAQD